MDRLVVPLVDNTTFATLLTAAATVIAALLGLIGSMLVVAHNAAKRSAAKTDVLVENVQNSHHIGMRDDLDEKFRAQNQALAGIWADVGGLKADMRLIRRDQTEDRAEASRAVEEARKAVEEARRAVDEAQRAAQLAKEALEKTTPDKKED